MRKEMRDSGNKSAEAQGSLEDGGTVPVGLPGYLRQPMVSQQLNAA